MSKLKFNTNDDVVILTLGGTDYIAANTSTGSPFTLFPGANGVSPGVELYKVTAADECTIDANRYIRDIGNVNHFAIVGQRPRNIVRR